MKYINYCLAIVLPFTYFIAPVAAAYTYMYLPVGLNLTAEFLIDVVAQYLRQEIIHNIHHGLPYNHLVYYFNLRTEVAHTILDFKNEIEADQALISLIIFDLLH